MIMRRMFSPGPLTIGGSGHDSGSQFISNPWDAGSSVWLQCTTKYVTGRGQSEFGISEIHQLTEEGEFVIEEFGDDAFGSYLSRKWVPRLLGVTVSARTFDAGIEGTLTLFGFDDD